MSFPTIRPRRLRSSKTLRDMLAQTDLRREHLIAPIFIKEGLNQKTPIASMPGVFQHGLNDAVETACRLEAAGVRAVILFGIPSKKDARGSQAYDPNGVVQKAVAAIKAKTKTLLVITDVCLCEYTSHSHCGLLKGGDNNQRANASDEGKAPVGFPLEGATQAPIIDNDPTLELLAKTALSHAQAGADIVAPSDMMDGRVATIRQALDAHQFENTAIMSYAVKYASHLYGPFRDAAENTPESGDRKTYQMDFRNRDEAVREALLDEQEGADFLMVKPASLYLDILSELKAHTALPLVAYQVSGEYSLIKAAAQNRWIDEKGLVIESLTAMRRAGAQLIITYFAEDLAQWLA